MSLTDPTPRMGDVLTARRSAHRDEGPLAATFRAAMQIWEQQQADGVSLAERVDGLTKSLQAAWPQGRPEPWRYLCEHCGDLGVVVIACPGDRTCRRTQPHLPHDFVQSCWCDKRKSFERTPARSEDFTAAGKTSKPTKVGR